MKRSTHYVFILSTLAIVTLLSNACTKKITTKIDVDNMLSYCDNQIKKTLQSTDNDSCMFPRSIEKDSTNWKMIQVYDWTSGFWPGILWLDYEITNDDSIKQKAIKYTDCISELLNPQHRGDHDLGFQFYCSYGNAYRMTKDEKYKEILIKGADKLAGFFNPKVGTILSWPHMSEVMGWPHNTIMDNMMNLELLFWAAKNGGNPDYYKMAESHARVTMNNQFREDYTCYHVAIYDTISGKMITGVTNQGYSDESFWARGQAWAIYGFTMVYRETSDKTYLRFVEKVADKYLSSLPDDFVPYWDFSDPAIPNAPRDASSAAIVASGLLQLSQLEDNKEKSTLYFLAAENMLKSLSSKSYLSEDKNSAILLHSTGNYPANYEIDASINYADYYYIEALKRYKKQIEVK